MASEINKQPPFPILPAYRPVAFEMFFDTLTSSSRGENAVVRVYKDGVELTDRPIRQKSSRNETSPLSPLDTRWYFEIDIQTDCQETLAPYVSLPSGFVNPATRFASNMDMFGVYYITVTFEIVDLTTGLLEDSGIDQETSEEFTVFSASKGNLEGMFLSEYYGVWANQDINFLTKSKRSLTICREESALLTLISPPDMPAFPLGLNSIRVIIYDSGNNILSVSISAFSFVVKNSEQLTINTGIEALQNGFWLPLIPDFSDPELSYYTIEAGEGNFILQTFQSQTEVFTYFPKKSCCSNKSLRLHWMNRLGGIDSFTFDDAKDLRETTTSERGKKALGWVIGGTSPHKTSSEGLFKYNSQSIQQYLVTTRFLTNNEALWLSELLSSSKVYIDVDNTFTLVACTVQDTTQSITRNDGKIKYSLVLTLSNNPINHRL
jgi:hypothetical protein